jgi:hypothetical protein
MALKTKSKVSEGVPMGFYFDPETHRYFMDGVLMTGCTTILGVMAKPALIPWAAGKVVEYIKAECEFVKQDVADGKDGYYMVAESDLAEAKVAHTKFRDKRAAEGTDLHAIVETYIKRCIEQGGKPQDLLPDEADIEQFHLWAVEHVDRFIESEVKLYSKTLFVAGTADFIFEKGGKLFVGDIKNKKKIYGREPFFQCAGYSIMKSEMDGSEFDGYCVVRLWESEIEPLWSFDTEGDKEGFLACARLYRLLAENNIVK